MWQQSFHSLCCMSPYLCGVIDHLPYCVTACIDTLCIQQVRHNISAVHAAML